MIVHEVLGDRDEQIGDGGSGETGVGVAIELILDLLVKRSGRGHDCCVVERGQSAWVLIRYEECTDCGGGVGLMMRS